MEISIVDLFLSLWIAGKYLDHHFPWINWGIDFREIQVNTIHVFGFFQIDVWSVCPFTLKDDVKVVIEWSFGFLNDGLLFLLNEIRIDHTIVLLTELMRFKN